jgi:hypothetical protein
MVAVLPPGHPPRAEREQLRRFHRASLQASSHPTNSCVDFLYLLVHQRTI